jgi:hypothetical protein
MPPSPKRNLGSAYFTPPDAPRTEVAVELPTHTFDPLPPVMSVNDYEHRLAHYAFRRNKILRTLRICFVVGLLLIRYP